MNPVSSQAITVIEAAYDLEKPDSVWLADLITAVAPILERGLGIFGFEFVRPPAGRGGSDAVVRGMHLRSLPDDFMERFEAARNALPPELAQAVTPPGYAGSWSDLVKYFPRDPGSFLEKLGYPDIFGILAVDPNGVGVHISAPLPEVTTLTPKSRERWQMLGAHISSAYRLRRALSQSAASVRATTTGLPHEAEAVFDPEGLRMVEATGSAKNANAALVLRDAARNVDRARGDLRRDDPQQALETWKALVSGRWSMVDWFDTDGRRFILAVPNPPEVRDPRGLTPQERRVMMYIVLGETSKLVAYRLGLSQARVSTLLKSAMRKLGVTSKAELLQKLGPVGIAAVAGGADHGD